MEWWQYFEEHFELSNFPMWHLVNSFDEVQDDGTLMIVLKSMTINIQVWERESMLVRVYPNHHLQCKEILALTLLYTQYYIYISKKPDAYYHRVMSSSTLWVTKGNPTWFSNKVTINVRLLCVKFLSNSIIYGVKPHCTLRYFCALLKLKIFMPLRVHVCIYIYRGLLNRPYLG